MSVPLAHAVDASFAVQIA